MPHSMTGFATAETLAPPFRLIWEVRSVNHRFLELAFRLPDDLRGIEPDCRELVAAVARRGKIDCTLRIVAAEGATQHGVLSADALSSLRLVEDQIRSVFPQASPLTVGEIVRSAGVLTEPGQQLAALAEPAKRCFTEALEALRAARLREGTRIAEVLERRNVAIAQLLEDVRPLLAAMLVRHRDKLRERLARLDVQAQPERLEQELALVAQRVDVAEEVDRLASHVTEVLDTLRRDEPIGRRLDFLTQELNREANTFASKVQDEALTRTAVELKVLIEQMREQVQNVE